MDRLSDKEIKVLSDAIMLAHTDASSQDSWLEMIALIRQVIPSDGAVAAFFDTETGGMERDLWIDVEPRGSKEYAEHYHFTDFITPKAQAQGTYVFRPTDIVSAEVYRNSEFYNDFLLGFGNPTNQLILVVGQGTEWQAHMSLGRYAPDDIFSDNHVQFLSLLQPHITQAFYKAKELSSMNEDLNILLSSLDDYVMAGIIFDSSGSLLHMSKLATKLCESPMGKGDRLFECVQSMAMEHCLQRADNPEAGRRIHSTSLQCGERHYRIAIFCVEASDGERYCIVRFAEAGRRIKTLVARLAASHQLSPREMEVCEMLAKGASNRKISDTLGISEHTAKDHVASVMQKLGITDRYRLIASLLGY